MKALVLSGKNQELQIEERPDLVPGEGEAVVRIRAAALNHRDLWIQKGQYAGLKYPIVLGADGAGVVTSVSAGGDSWIGKEVIINPSQHWGDHQSHQDQQTFRILGLPEDGTMAEYVKVPLSSLVEKPGHLSFEQAAAVPLAGLTAFRALFSRGRLAANEKVLITGIGGGVALFALQYAVAAGARAYVTSGDEQKLDKAIKLGASGGANYKTADWSKNLKHLAAEFDCIIDGAAGDGLNELLDLAVAGGRVVLYGATKGNPSELVARRIFWKQLNVLGSTMGSPSDFAEMIAFIAKHKIVPVVDKVFSFSEGQAALRWMDDARQFGKIVVRID